MYIVFATHRDYGCGHCPAHFTDECLWVWMGVQVCGVNLCGWVSAVVSPWRGDSRDRDPLAFIRDPCCCWVSSG